MPIQMRIFLPFIYLPGNLC